MKDGVKLLIAVVCAVGAVITGILIKISLPCLAAMIIMKIFWDGYPLGWVATVLIPVLTFGISYVLCLFFGIWAKSIE